MQDLLPSCPQGLLSYTYLIQVRLTQSANLLLFKLFLRTADSRIDKPRRIVNDTKCLVVRNRLSNAPRDTGGPGVTSLTSHSSARRDAETPPVSNQNS